LNASVVIRIDSLQQGPSVVMRLAGSLSGPDVGVLRDSVVRQGLPDRIDLSEVEFVDAEGASELLGLEARGARLVGAEPYVELLLRDRPGSIPQ
jgi:anti-anti-sigma regulatory factor